MVLLLSASPLSESVGLAAEDWLHSGFLFDQFGLTLESGRRTEAVGPLYYQQQRETEETWAFPPLLSYTRDPAVELKELDFVYPLLTYDCYGQQYRWQLFQLLSVAGGPTQTESERHRYTLYPVFFMQRSSDTNENYLALGPFYGHLKNRLMRDEISYVMFPAYSRTRKKDVVTDNYLYPFFHLRQGNGLTGWQLWPFYGREHKEVTFFTNNFNDVETRPGHDRLFAMWPLFADQKSNLGTDNPSREQMFLPFYSYQRSPQRDSTTVLWPFFTSIDDRARQYHEWEGPWPFVVLANGPGKHTTRFWPVFSHAQSPVMESRVYLWPIYRYQRIHSEPMDRRRTRIVYFLYSDLTEKNTESGTARHRVDLWPLWFSRRDHNGNTRVQVPALLEAFVPGSHKIERDYSPVWALWRSEKNAQSGANSQSLLWNFYRRDAAPDRTRVSFLFGLFQYRADAEGQQLRLFYLPVKGKSASEKSGAR